MLKYVAIFAVVTYFGTCCNATENYKTEAEAALALAKLKQCICHDDLNQCREESKKTGKPLVISVNKGCDGLSKEVPWAIFCKVKSYSADIDKESTFKEDTPRFIILSVDKKNEDLFIRKSLLTNLTTEDFKLILVKETKVRLSKVLLNWE